MSKKKILIAIVGLAIAGGGGFAYWKKSRADVVEYREIKVKRGDINVSILSTGTVQPENRLEIKPPIAGRIESVLVKEGQFVKKGQVLAWMSSTERAALLDAARAKGNEEYKRWQEMYRPAPVLAPINGTIILRNIEPGQSFVSTDPILVMSDRLTVKAQVDETDIAQIQLHQPAEIILDAYASEKIPAKVDQIAFEAKTVNNVTTYLVDVLPDNTPAFMRSGMTANVTFVLESKKDTLLVPSDSLKRKAGKTSVLVREVSGEQAEKEVTLGVSDGKQTEVLSGVSEGDTVLAAQVNVKGSRKSQSSSPFSPPSHGGGGRGGRR